MLTEEQKKLITIAKTGRNIFLSGGPEQVNRMSCRN